MMIWDYVEAVIFAGVTVVVAYKVNIPTALGLVVFYSYIPKGRDFRSASEKQEGKAE